VNLVLVQTTRRPDIHDMQMQFAMSLRDLGEFVGAVVVTMIVVARLLIR
jgi:hypothetical protein